DLGVLAPEPGHAVGQAGGVLQDLLVEAARGLGGLDVDREPLLAVLRGGARAGGQGVLAAQAVGVVGDGQSLLEPGDGPPQAEPLSLGRLQGAGGWLVWRADTLSLRPLQGAGGCLVCLAALTLHRRLLPRAPPRCLRMPVPRTVVTGGHGSVAENGPLVNGGLGYSVPRRR